MHKYKFSGHHQTVLHFETQNEISLEVLWENSIKSLAERAFTQVLASGDHQDLIANGFFDLSSLIQFGAVYCQDVRMVSDKWRTEKMSANSLLRFHFCPRRYFYLWENLEQRIIYEEDQFLVLDKPAGVPIHPCLDNATENILVQLEKLNGQSYFSVHRLDVETQGLLILAKTRRAQEEFHRIFQQRKIRKQYEAIVLNSQLPLGKQVHWMRNSKRAPKVIVSQKEENAKICELNILEVSELESAFLRDRFNLNPNKKYEKVKIELETGRTHQIRAQLHYLGSPIVGDKLYGGDSNPRLSLQASCIEFINPFTQIMQKFTLESVQEL